MNFLRNLFGVSIRSKVMALIETRIKDAQKRYDADVNSIREEYYQNSEDLIENFNLQVNQLTEDFKNKKSAAAENYVNEIVNKFI